MSGTTGLILAGDVMTGRGVDQILPEPGLPNLQERYVVDARAYVDLAERVNGTIPKPVDPPWPWGDALAAMEEAGPTVRVMNLETSVTVSEEFAADKGVHYRMNPANVDVLAAANVDVWTLANNHVLDHGRPGLLETLHTLRHAGLCTAGAGEDEREAWAPAVVEARDGRVLVLSVGHASSGIPSAWAATSDRAGVALLRDLSDQAASAIGERMNQHPLPGDVRVVSVHWGGNWGYDVPPEHQRFAHRLIDAGVHVVHGHSSHHPRPIEVYRGGLVLYGCGDLVNDYEGIRGYEEFRDDLRLLYLLRQEPGSGELRELSMVPFQARRMRLWRASGEDASWMARTLHGACRRFGTSVSVGDGGLLRLDWAG